MTFRQPCIGKPKRDKMTNKLEVMMGQENHLMFASVGGGGCKRDGVGVNKTISIFASAKYAKLFYIPQEIPRKIYA
jgi:hypothetical protein